MNDAPKHLSCEKGQIGQFYRISGTSRFKCKPCGEIRERDSFLPIEFKWKSDPEAWQKWADK